MPRPKILIVDDKPNMRKLCSDILGGRYDIETAEDGAQALQKLDAGTFDVVLTDIRMPLLDGRRLLDAIRQRGLPARVILMTAFGTIKNAVDAMKAGAFDYVSKPFDPEELEAVVGRAVGGSLDAPQELAAPPAGASEAAIDPTSRSYRETLTLARDRTSQQYLVALLRACEGNVTRAADLADIERESLHRLMRRHGIRAEDFRPRHWDPGRDEDPDPKE